MQHFCALILHTIFTHDEKTMPELAHLIGEPGCAEAQAAVYTAAAGNRKETMQCSEDRVDFYGREA